jgi:hypothetical protein
MTRLCQYAVAACSGVLVSVALIGCSHDRPDSLSSNAVLAAQGNRALAYTAPGPGMVSVYDTADDTVLYSGKVNKGDSVVADIDHDRIAINGRTMSQRHLNHGQDHRIYFEPLQTTSNLDNGSTVTRTTHVETRTESVSP